MTERVGQCPLLHWQEIKDIISRNKLQLLGRSPSQHESYMKFSTGIKSKWVSVVDYLLNSKFDFDSELDPNTGKLKVNRPEQYEIKTLLTINDFPYHFADGIHHYVYWKLGSSIELTDQEVIDVAINFMQSNTHFIEYAFYINPPHLKSILELDHAHILFYEGTKI